MQQWLGDFWTAFRDTSTSPVWWGENILWFAVFTVLLWAIGWGLNYLRILRYRNWTVLLVPPDAAGTEEGLVGTLSARDVENYRSSSVEEWRFIKSHVGNFGQVYTRGMEKALADGWLSISPGHWWRGGGRYLIDITRIPDGDFSPHRRQKPDARQ